MAKQKRQELSWLPYRYGLPIVLVSDNGPQFTSQEFQNFLRGLGIKHHLTAPATNGQAARFVQTIKTGLHAVLKHPCSFQDKVQNFLMHFRKVPHATTGGESSCVFSEA